MRKNFSLEIYVIFMVTAECCLRAIYDALRRLNTNTYGNHESGFNIAKENPRLFGRGLSEVLQVVGFYYAAFLRVNILD